MKKSMTTMLMEINQLERLLRSGHMSKFFATGKGTYDPPSSNRYINQIRDYINAYLRVAWESGPGNVDRIIVRLNPLDREGLRGAWWTDSFPTDSMFAAKPKRFLTDYGSVDLTDDATVPRGQIGISFRRPKFYVASTNTGVEVRKRDRAGWVVLFDFKNKDENERHAKELVEKLNREDNA